MRGGTARLIWRSTRARGCAAAPSFRPDQPRFGRAFARSQHVFAAGESIAQLAAISSTMDDRTKPDASRRPVFDEQPARTPNVIGDALSKTMIFPVSPVSRAVVLAAGREGCLWAAAWV